MGVASRLSAANSNAHRKLRPTRTARVFADKSLEIQVPSMNMRVFEQYLASKSCIGLVAREVLALVYIYYFFKPFVHSFPGN
jgi:hypothetical protein